MTPDTPTLFIVGAMICGLAAALQWLVARRRHSPALVAWAAANLGFSLGCVIHAARPLMPLPLSVILGNGLLVLGTALLLGGLNLFDGRRLNRLELLAGPLLAMAALAGSLARGGGSGELAFIMSLPIGYYVIRAALVLPRLANAGASGVRIMCSAIMLAFALLYLLRGVMVYAGLLQPVDAAVGLIGGLVRILALAMAAAWSVCSLVLVLDREASQDHLTALLNRRACLAGGDRLVAGALSRGRPLAVLALDIDHFKLVNDRHGHHTGDAVLRELAQLTTLTVREGDLVGRIGGEEFCIVLPEADEAQARQVAERLRERCEQTLAQACRLPGAITISIGVATLAAGDPDFASLLRRADAALYQAKAQGRNRTVCAATSAGSELPLRDRRG